MEAAHSVSTCKFTAPALNPAFLGVELTNISTVQQTLAHAFKDSITFKEDVEVVSVVIITIVR